MLNAVTIAFIVKFFEKCANMSKIYNKVHERLFGYLGMYGWLKFHTVVVIMTDMGPRLFNGKGIL